MSTVHNAHARSAARSRSRLAFAALLCVVAAGAAAAAALEPPPPPGPAATAPPGVGARVEAERTAVPPAGDAPGDVAPPAEPGDLAPAPAAATDDARAPEDPAGLLVEVVGEDGAAVPHAIATSVAGERDLATARGDERGRARLPAATSALRAEAPEHWPATAVVAGTAMVRVVLPRAPLLRGRVFTAAGEPCAQARVALLPAVVGRAAWPASLPPGASCTQAARDGSFVLQWPDAHPHDLVAAANGAAAVVMPALAPALCAEAPLVVRLAPPAALVGTARCGAAPLAQAAVELWSATAPPAAAPCGPPMPWRSGQLLAAARTDACGEFAFADVGAGPVWVALPDEAAHAHVVLGAFATAQVRLDVPPRARVRGVVARDVTAAQVFIYGGSTWLQRSAVGARGEFAFAPLPAGRYLVGAAGDGPDALHVAIQQFLLCGRAEGAAVVELVAGGDVELRLAVAVAPPGSVHGSAFVGAAPAAGSRVVVDTVPPVGAWRRTAVADARGEFSLPVLLPGDYDVRWFGGDGRSLGAAACRVTAGAATPLTLRTP